MSAIDTLKIFCEICDGYGYLGDGEIKRYTCKCNSCDGNGFIEKEVASIDVICEKCKGEGCTKCYMMGYVTKQGVIKDWK